MAVDLAIPSGLDASRILAFQMREGKTAEQIIAETAAIIGAVNQALMDKYGGLLYETQLDHAIYRRGLGGPRRRTPKKVEGKQADPVRGDIIGHMLPFSDYEDGVAWTPLYLRDAWQIQIDADLREVGDSWTNEVDATVITRMLTNTENLVGAGWDVPWAIGSGVNLPFIPPNNGSYQFDGSHTHFLFVNGAVNSANVVTALDNAQGELRHHGFGGRLTAIVSEADLSAYTGITSKKFATFVPPTFTVVAGNPSAPTLVTTGELEGMPGELFGYFNGDKGFVELRWHPRIPSGYFWMGKSFGRNNQRNPLALREHPTMGFGLVPRPQVTNDVMPELDKVLFKAGYGVGVNDRLNGVAMYIASGASQYVNPSIE
jgi:hypothetical protein